MPARSVSDPDYHLGHLFLDCIREKSEGIFQIDAATGQEESHASVLSRTIRLANSLRKLGFEPGDVLAIGGRNHLDIHIPSYAASMIGLPVLGVDPEFKYDEIKSLFELTQPKIAFCDEEHQCTYMEVADDLNLDTRVFTFTGENSMGDLIASENDLNLDKFEPSVFDLDKVYAWLVSSGGTTGTLKVAAVKHRKCIENIVTCIQNLIKQGPSDSAKRNIGIFLSPVQWASGYMNTIVMPLSNQIKLQTSAPATPDHVIDIINKYKPTCLMWGPSLLASIIKHEKKCDLTCFDVLVLGGAKASVDLLMELSKRKRPDAVVVSAYGQTETIGQLIEPNPKGPIGNCGKLPNFDRYKLVDPETGKEITEPNIPGELWSKGATFTEYYKDPVETAKAFTEDGWFRTGDILYRDEDNNMFFVDRLKMLIKYRSYHVRPLELEELIRTLPGVRDVAVTAIPDRVDGEHPAACVVREKESRVTAQEIKDLVASKLSNSKQLRGGIVFVDQIPKTSTDKVARSKLRNIVLQGIRE